MKIISEKITAVITVLFILLSVSAAGSITAAAADEQYYYYYDGSKKYSRAEKYIADKFCDMSDVINISSYKLTAKDLELIITDILLSRPDIFYIDTEYSYSLTKGSEYVSYVLPNYCYPKNTINRRKEELEHYSGKLLSGINDSWSDVKKALYIHDMLAVKLSYNDKNEIRSAYEGIVGDNAICVSYALAYKLLMDKLGIKCVCVISTDMSHCWNMVKIDGNWYHIDVTWDDLTPDLMGMTSHDLFMISDSAIQNHDVPSLSHYNWLFGYTADSTLYDSDMFWKQTESRVIPVTDDLWYYIDNYSGALSRYNWKTGKTANICKIGRNWKSVNLNNYYYCFSRLDYSDGILYFNSADTIYSYNIRTKEVTEEKKLSLTAPDAIYGMMINDGMLEYELSSSPLDRDPRKKTAFSVVQSESLKAPESFRGVARKSDSGYSIKLTWNRVRSADGYTIYKYDPDTKKAVKLSDTRSLKFTIKGLKKGSYSYIICAYKIINGKKIYGDFSSTVTKNLK